MRTLLRMVPCLGFLLALGGGPAIADPILADNFNDGYGDWIAGGEIDGEDLHTLVPDSVRLRGNGTLTRFVSTAGYHDVTIGFFLAARLLEAGDRCHFEVSTDGGGSWMPLMVLAEGEDDGEFRWDAVSSLAYDDNAGLVLRFRAEHDATSDHCYAEDVSVSGFPLESPPCEAGVPGDPFPGYVEDYDPLSGSGATGRSELTWERLSNGPPPASQLIGEASSGSFVELLDDYRYTGSGDDPRKHLPEFHFEFVQSGSHLVPVRRGIVLGDHPYWEYLLEPGRVWSETGDQGMSRAALPFALMQKNSNCLHNGLMTFLFDDSSVSQVAYQITLETCLYYQFDMWGQLEASYTPGPVPDALSIKSAHQEHRASLLPLKPIDDLATDYPGVDPGEFAHPSEVAAEDLTIYGVIVDGTHYAAGCATRYGDHPYCDGLRVPSYSTAKTTFAASASLRLERLYPGYFQEILADWIPEAAADPEGDFAGVSIDHALDMATGNFRLGGYIDDENSSSMNDFFLPETHAEKVHYSVSRFPRSAPPGTEMHYHTTDTYLAAVAGQRFLREQEGWCADLFDDAIVEEQWRPLGLSPGSFTTRRTYDPVAQPFGGYGLSYLRDDVAKLATFLGRDHGRIHGEQVLDARELAAGKFALPSEPGLPWSAEGSYNNSFWGRDRSAVSGCATTVPYLSGYGGITIALMPSGVVYYYFSDGGSFVWDRAFVEAEGIRSSCNVDPPAPPTDLVAISITETTITLRWTPSADPIGVIRYRIFRDDVEIGLTLADDWVDTGLSPGVSYRYFVEALDAVDQVSQTGASLELRTELDELGDLDGDGVPNGTDCAPEDPDNWSIPAQVESLRVHEQAGETIFSWDPLPGGSVSVEYELLRSEGPSDFETASACLRTPAESLQEGYLPALATASFYLVRAVNGCGGGSLGAGSESSEPRAGTCP